MVRTSEQGAVVIPKQAFLPLHLSYSKNTRTSVTSRGT